MATATGTAFLMPDILGDRAVAQERVKIPEAERIIITVIVDNLADALRPDDKIARRHVGRTSALESILHAEHGLAYHVETVVDAQSHSFLFDFATDFHGLNKNIELLGLDLKRIEALALSHDHLDHQAALMELLKARRTDIPHGTPFYVGEQFFMGTYMRRPDGNVVSLLALKREDIEGLGLLRIVEVKTPTPIVPGAHLAGRIERFTDYELIPPVFVAKEGNHLFRKIL